MWIGYIYLNRFQVKGRTKKNKMFQTFSTSIFVLQLQFLAHEELIYRFIRAKQLLILVCLFFCFFFPCHILLLFLGNQNRILTCPTFVCRKFFLFYVGKHLTVYQLSKQVESYEILFMCIETNNTY